MIPESEWVWQGHGAHFPGDCKFHMGTRVGGYLISTIGDYYTRAGERERLGGGEGSYFETFVFKAAGTLECGCAEIADLCEIEGIRYGTATEAQAGHIAMCRQYAGLE